MRRLSATVVLISCSWLGGVIVASPPPPTAQASLVSSTPIDLGTLGGANSYVHGISENGVVYGQSGASNGEFGFAWSAATGMVSLSLGGTFSWAHSINDDGMVVGIATLPGDTVFHAFAWTAAGGMVDIGTLGGNYSVASVVNNDGLVAGWSRVAGEGDVRHIFKWTLAGGMVDLGTLGGDSAYPVDITDSGFIAGSSLVFHPEGGGFVWHGFIWSEATGMVDLNTLGGTQSEVHAVNDAGMVVGKSDTGWFANSHAFVWTPTGGMIDIGPEGVDSRADFVNANGLVAGWAGLAFVWSEATGRIDLSLGGSFSGVAGLNDSGLVAGWAYTAGNASQQTFIWTPADGLSTLGALGDESYMTSVNEQGRVIGDYVTYPDSFHPFVWSEATGRVDLNMPEGVVGVVEVLNNNGMIVGDRFLPDGSVRAMVWMISEPQPPNVVATPTGENVQVAPIATLPGGFTAPVAVSFSSVTTGGATTVTASDSGPAVPSGFNLPEPPLFFDVSTTASFTGAVTLCFPWVQGSIQNEANVRLLHYENGAWQDITTSVNQQTNVVCGNATSLSPFVIAELGLEFGGFSPPLLPDGSASIQQNKAGRTIPVKFQLRFNGQLTSAATATIAVFRILNVATGTTDTTDLTEDAGAANENSDRFRYDAAAQQYIYNLNTKGWLAPATYRIVVTLGDGSTHTVDFSLR